jgi:hypothetical protein
MSISLGLTCTSIKVFDCSPENSKQKIKHLLQIAGKKCELKRTLNPTLKPSTFESVKAKKMTKNGMAHTERITQELSKFAISAIQNEDSQNQEMYYF